MASPGTPAVALAPPGAEKVQNKDTSGRNEPPGDPTPTQSYVTRVNAEGENSLSPPLADVSGEANGEDVGGDVPRPTSAPPLMEEFQKAYGQIDGTSGVKPFTDIRLDEDYEEFYKKYSKLKKLPPPVENRHLYAEVAANSPKRGLHPGQGPAFGPAVPDASEEGHTGCALEHPVKEGGSPLKHAQVSEQEQRAQEEKIKEADAALSGGLSRLRLNGEAAAGEGLASLSESAPGSEGNQVAAPEGGAAHAKATNPAELPKEERVVSASGSSTAPVVDKPGGGETTGVVASTELPGETLKGLSPAQGAAIALLQGGGLVPGAASVLPAVPAGLESLLSGAGAAATGTGAALAAAAAAVPPAQPTIAAGAATDGDATAAGALQAGLPGGLPVAAAAAAAGIAPSNMHLYEQLLRARLGPSMDMLTAIGAASPDLNSTLAGSIPGGASATATSSAAAPSSAPVPAARLVPGLETLGLGGLDASTLAGLGLGLPGGALGIPGTIPGVDLVSAAAALQAARLAAGVPGQGASQSAGLGSMGTQGQIPGLPMDVMSTAAALAILQGAAGGAPLDIDAATLLQVQQIQRAQQLIALQAQLQGMVQQPGAQPGDPSGAANSLLQSAEALKMLQGTDTTMQQQQQQQQLLLWQLLQQQQQQQQAMSNPSNLPLGLTAPHMRTGVEAGSFPPGSDRAAFSQAGMGGGGYVPRPRGGRDGAALCRFYQQSGFCARGDSCPYLHGYTQGSPGPVGGVPSQHHNSRGRGGARGRGNFDQWSAYGVANESWQNSAVGATDSPFGNRASPPFPGAAPLTSSALGSAPFSPAPGPHPVGLRGSPGMGTHGHHNNFGRPGPLDPNGTMNAYGAVGLGQSPGYPQYGGALQPHVPEHLGALGASASKYTSLAEVEGRMASIARDQHGCRFLQRQFDEGTREDIDRIYSEIREPLIELMVDPFGNYLVQKLMEVCSREQQLEILAMVTAREGELVNISLNMHGTRSSQKLIETLTAPEDIAQITQALEPGVITLIKDLNGNHVIQRCLQRLTAQQNEFIFKAAIARCVEVATHRHGCCVLQRCIDFADEGQRGRLVAEIACNTLVLSQDPFGNYVVQYILDLGLPWAVEEVSARIKGQVAVLATQKFSSNVVEKCLKSAPEQSKQQVILELITSPRLGQLLQDPFANYVVQSALSVAKGNLYASFVEAIRPHAVSLRSSPYGKRILSKTNLKPR